MPTTSGIAPSASPRSSAARAPRPSPRRSAAPPAPGQRRAERAVVLLGQHLGRRHQGGLGARLDRPQHGQHGDQRLAEPTSPCSSRSIRRGAARSASISASAWICDRCGRDEPKRCERLGAQTGRRPSRGPAGARTAAPPHQRERDLAGQQLVIGQTAAGAARRAARAGAWTAPQRLGEARPALAPQQGRRHAIREASGTRASACADRRRAPARPQPGGQRPDRLERRQPLAPVGAGPCDRDAAWSAGRRIFRSCPRPAGARRAASGASRLNLKNTSSAKPVPSRTTIRHGWRGVAGGSCRTTSTSSVAIRPGTAARWSAGRGGRDRIRAGGTADRSPDRPPPPRAISFATAGPMPRSEVRGAKTGASGSCCKADTAGNRPLYDTPPMSKPEHAAARTRPATPPVVPRHPSRNARERPSRRRLRVTPDRHPDRTDLDALEEVLELPDVAWPTG